MKRKVNRKISNEQEANPDRRLLRWSGRLLVLSVALSGIVFGVIRITDPSTLPIRSVQIEGAFKYLEVAQLQETVSKYAGSSFFDLDISHIQETVKNMGWVDQVSVRRIWPDTVRIRVKEHVPLARWEENGLVNIRGEWFDVRQDASVKMLPEFSGPEGFSRKLTEKYHEIQKILAPAGLDIAKLKMDQRRTWKIALENGIDIELGRSGVGPRLNRFVRIYPLLLAQLSAGLSL
ncbi:MAG: cell division protein FtsQ/DivIB, partial [Gammaproteobacteria bacterium]|nr:cell division protein FtsQ/DivIB [Gammaproteobacteria bacterium]